MLEQITPDGRVLHIGTDSTEARTVLKALASVPRLRILELLGNRVCNVSEIAKALDLPLSTAALHVRALEEAGLIRAELVPAVRGLQKVCARVYDGILVEIPRGDARTQEAIDVSMPVGAYSDFDVTPTCGLASEKGIIGLLDDPASFYEPDRIRAQLLWFRQGYVEYRFPNHLPPRTVPDVLLLSLEMCSEAPLHHDDWPSDITVWINQVEIGTWTSPADFGGQRGALTPEWWEDWNSQYGALKVWQVNGEGGFVDSKRVSAVRLQDLHLTDSRFISVRIGVKPDARHVGGLNIFGRHFGNYPQDIVLRICYQ